jgi:two-component system NarL family sensor kinase
VSAAAAAWTLLAVSTLVPGVALLVGAAPAAGPGDPRGVPGRSSGLALVVAGAALALGVVLSLAGEPAAGTRAASVATGLAGPLAVALYPSVRWAHPVDLLAAVAVVGAGAVALVWPAATAASTFALVPVLLLRTWWAVEGATGRRRRALTWLALAVGASAFVAGVVAFAVADPPGPDLAVLAFAVVGPAMWVGVRRPDLDGRELVVVVLGHLVTMLLLVSVLVGLLALVSPDGITAQALPLWAILAALLAAGYHPVQQVLRGTLEEVVRGHRADPLRAAGEVTSRLGTDLEDGLRAVRDALALPWAALREASGAEVASSGTRPARTVSLPLADDLGLLEVGLRAHDDGLSRTDARVLALALPLLARSLHLRALADDVQQARREVVAAREEERRRLRRDLHDGLGPLLSGVALTADAAGNLLVRDPAAAAGLLADLRAQAGTALDDVRRLVYGMRPPALDELGLVPALRQALDRLRAPDGTAFAVDLDGEVPVRLPAAVEVAAYRVALEAATNAARHSGTAGCRVRLRLDGGALVVTVADDGTGGPVGPWRPGVGLSSMRERAEEVGGSLRAAQTGAGGLVEAVLPLGPAAREPAAAARP